MIDKENVFRRLGIHSKGGTYNVMFLVINILGKREGTDG